MIRIILPVQARQQPQEERVIQHPRPAAGKSVPSAEAFTSFACASTICLPSRRNISSSIGSMRGKLLLAEVIARVHHQFKPRHVLQHTLGARDGINHIPPVASMEIIAPVFFAALVSFSRAARQVW